jgi:drug/metabolite transporter (DMT)-like permease
LNKEKIIANLLLLLTSIIWGSAFVAQRVGMDYVGPLTFGFVRFILAALVLIPVMHFMKRSNEKKVSAQKWPDEDLSREEKKQERKTLLTAGLICGAILFCGSTLQQFGLVFTTAGKAGFITALYIVLVPIFSMVLRHKPSLKCWVGVAFGAVGLYLLCITESFTIAPGDLIVLIGAGFWTAHLLVIDHFLKKIKDPVQLSFIQFSVCALLSMIGAFLFEDIYLSEIIDAAIPIFYAGALSGGVGFTLQIVGQKHTSPTVASLLLSMEAVFGAVFGFLILNELMTSREIVGCILMFSAIVISQLPDKKKPECIS